LQPGRTQRTAKQQAGETLCKHKLKANCQSCGISFTTLEASAETDRALPQPRPMNKAGLPLCSARGTGGKWGAEARRQHL